MWLVGTDSIVPSGLSPPRARGWEVSRVPDKFNDITFIVYKDAKGEFRWRLKGRNWETLGDSGEGYVNKSDCLHAIGIVKRDAAASSTLDQTVK